MIYVLLIIAGLGYWTNWDKVVPVEEFPENQAVALSTTISANSLRLYKPGKIKGSGEIFNQGNDTLSVDGLYSYGDFSLSLDTSISNIERKSQNGDSSNFAMNHYGRTYGAEIQYHSVKGFSSSSMDAATEPLWSEYDGQPYREDIKITSYGFNVYHAFFPNQYSPRFVSGYGGMPKDWGWSPLLMLSHDAFSITMKGPLLPAKYRNQYGAAQDFSGGLFTTTSLSMGFGLFYPWDHWFLHGTAMGGRGIELRRYNIGDKDISNSSTSGQKSFVRLAAGYLADPFVIGFHTSFDTKKTDFGGISMLYTNTVLSGTVSYMF